MKKNNNKIIIFLLSFLVILVFAGVKIGIAKGPLTDYDDMIMGADDMGEAAGFNTNITSGGGVGEIAELVIEGFLGLLGVIFIILMITAGYNWMSAAGDEKKVTKAKDTIWRAIIGLIIIVSAFAITYFVFDHMPGGGDVPPYEFSN